MRVWYEWSFSFLCMLVPHVHNNSINQLPKFSRSEWLRRFNYLWITVNGHSWFFLPKELFLFEDDSKLYSTFSFEILKWRFWVQMSKLFWLKSWPFQIFFFYDCILILLAEKLIHFLLSVLSKVVVRQNIHLLTKSILNDRAHSRRRKLVWVIIFNHFSIMIQPFEFHFLNSLHWGSSLNW